MTAPRAAIYLRVSTAEQAEHGVSLDFQRHACLQATGIAGCSDPLVYMDDGYTGTNPNRPALRELMSHLDEVDTLYVWRLDRLSRSVRDWSNIMAELAEADVGFVSVSERFDFSSPFGKAALNMLATFAELFIDILRENVRAAFAERARRGLHHGRAPMGYKRTGNPRDALLIDDTTAPLILDLFTRYAHGEAMNAIAQSLYSTPSAGGGTWSTNHVKFLLTNPAYIGQVRCGEDVLEGLHDPLIPRDL